MALHYSAYKIKITASMTIHNLEQCHAQGYPNKGQSKLYFLSAWYTARYFFWVSGGECHFCSGVLGHREDTTRVNQEVNLDFPGGVDDGKTWAESGQENCHPD